DGHEGAAGHVPGAHGRSPSPSMRTPEEQEADVTHSRADALGARLRLAPFVAAVAVPRQGQALRTVVALAVAVGLVVASIVSLR
ncbi:MAG TPA: hypothetical protein VN894_21145, partial [Polyangiaceae bacterium]|nr:hypothetical protein [Polyangiaceae bacterium]